MNVQSQRIGGVFRNINQLIQQTPGSKPHRIMDGDWMCPKCQNINFAKRDVCHQCQEQKPSDFNVLYFVGEAKSDRVTDYDKEFKRGDWYCRNCDFQNFAYRDRCKNCGSYK